ncbi:MAG: hypothetical protein C0467_30055 [Planctomycetaceae bacterium]|nr:hypothetical protein [Planctomycetaceae bacterium]
MPARRGVRGDRGEEVGWKARGEAEVVPRRGRGPQRPRPGGAFPHRVAADAATRGLRHGDSGVIRKPSAAELLTAAELYASLGWQLVPLHELLANGRCSCGRECGTSAGKHPRPSKWQEVATSNPVTIQHWWSRTPTANVGMKTGSGSGLVAIDIDPPHGEGALLALSDGVLPPTLTMTTGKGRRLLYAIPDSLEIEPQTVPFKDDDGHESIRLQGGNSGAQCVLPPSWHYSGRRYEWVAGHGPSEIEAAPMPGWVIAIMCPDPEPRHADPVRTNNDGDSPFAQFNARGDWWTEILAPAGAKQCGRGGQSVEYATRPGKKGGVSASIGHYRARDGSPALHVFSGNWPHLDGGRTYDKSGAYARIFHRGDFSAAGKDLLARGYGTPKARAGSGRNPVEDRVVRLERAVRLLAQELTQLRAERNGQQA